MFGFSSKPKNTCALVIDIESGGASAGLVHLFPDKPAEIVSCFHAELPYEDRTDEAQRVGVRTCIDEVVQKALDQRPADFKLAITGVHAIVHMPWVDVRVVRGESRQQTDVKVTQALIDKIAKEIMTREHMDVATRMETSIIRVTLNGYPTSKLFDKRAKSIAVTMLASSCDPHILENIKDIAAKSHVRVAPLLRSSVRGFAYGTTTLDPAAAGNHTIVDINRVGSRMIHIKNGLPVAITTIEYGLQSLFAYIAPHKHPADILAMMRMVEEHQTHDEVEDKFLQELGKAETKLSELYVQAFASISHVEPLPESLILIVHPLLASWLSRFFTRAEFATCVSTHNPFKVHVLTVEDYAKSVVCSPHVEATLSLVAATALVYNEHIRTSIT